MARRIVKEAKPQDLIEELLIRDVIDLTWEVLRMRRLKVGLLRGSMATGVRTMLDELGYGPSFEFEHNQRPVISGPQETNPSGLRSAQPSTKQDSQSLT